MAIAHSTSPDSVPQALDTDNVDLILRYCPGLDTHTPRQIARYIVGDSTTCWIWPDGGQSDEYAYIQTERTPYGYAQPVHVHRYMFDLLVGSIDITHHVHHKCQVKHCWNVFHLKEVSPKEHVAEHRVLRAPAPWRPPVQLTLAFMAGA